MHNFWTWMTIWGLTWGGQRVGLSGRGEREKTQGQLQEHKQ